MIVIECCGEVRQDEDGFGKWEIIVDFIESYLNRCGGEIDFYGLRSERQGKSWRERVWQ